MQNSAAIKLESTNQQAARPQVTKGEAAFGHRLPSGHLICDLCPRFCELAPGQRGWCQTRYNRRGRLWAANYNWLSILQFGRIESVPLVEYANGGVVLKVGSFGCNFKPQAEREHFGAQVGSGRSFTPLDLANICRSLVKQGCIGAAYLFAEPLMWYEFVMQSAMLLKQCDMRNVLATAGFVNPRPMQELLPYLDAVRFDLFAFDSAFYRNKMQISFAEVLISLKLLANSPVHLEVATPLLPGQNDEPEDVARIAAYLAQNYGPDIPYHLLAPAGGLSPEQKEKIMCCADAAGSILHRVYLS